jgi:hypothetical protein
MRTSLDAEVATILRRDVGAIFTDALRTMIGLEVEISTSSLVRVPTKMLIRACRHGQTLE